MYGQILRIDLGAKKISNEPVPREWQEEYLGGEGVNDRLLWEHFLSVSPHIDPVSSENVLIFGVGPLGATGALEAGTKVKWTFKSPTYGSFGDSVGGGFFGCQVRWAGYDYIVITGASEKPTYIWMYDDKVELRDADHLWGLDVHTADSILRKELKGGETALIGPAGENLVKFASIVMSRERVAARAGGGCVMGSKNLKGIIARGTKGIRIHSPKQYFKTLDEALRRMDQSIMWETQAKEGTMFLPQHYNVIGGTGWHNHQYNIVPSEIIAEVDGRFFLDNFKLHDVACSAGCSTACSHWWRIRGDETPASRQYAGESGEKPEFTVWGGCMAWGAKDLAAICHLQKIMNQYGLDAIEMGGCVALLMELYERGIITEEDINDWTGETFALRWGDYNVAEKIIESVALKRNALYDIVGRGVYETGRAIEERKGVPVIKYCQYGGKRSYFVEDIRTRRSWTLLMAVGTRGADHLKALSAIEQMKLTDIAEKYLGSIHAVDSDISHLKGILAGWEENRTAAMNATGVCIFNSSSYAYPGPDVDLISDACKAVTGIQYEDLFVIGERIYNLEKAFNSRLGFTRKDDTLCDRWMNEPIREGFPGAGMTGGDFFDHMLDEYYDYRGWDRENGLQTKVKLEELGLSDVASVLEKENALSIKSPSKREEVVQQAIRNAEEMKGMEK